MTFATVLGRVLSVIGVSLIALSPLTASAAPAVTMTTAAGWTGGAPLPAAKGIGLSRNQDGEPGMGVSPAGQFWIASDIAPYAASDPRVAGGLLSGADIWTSRDGGKTYRWVSDPFGVDNGQAGLAGEDTDLAVAPAKNSKGFYNVYAASLWVGSSSLASSQNGGKTWSVNPLGGIPTQDRPWLAADGPCTIYVTYHQLPLFTPFVSSYDVCTNGGVVPVSNGATLDPVNSTELTLSSFPGLSGSFNKQTVDTSPGSRFRHHLYVPMSLCKVVQGPDLVANANSPTCPKGTQYIVAVSSDKGQTFSYHKVALDKSGATVVWAATVTTDHAGNVYFAWSNNKSSFLDVSTDGGKHWSAPKRLNAPGTAAVYPTVAGGVGGRVDVAWYGANRTGDSNNAKAMGKPSNRGSAAWAVYLARSTNRGRSFSIRKVTGTIHLGELCTHGSGCGDTNSRNLLDDFGLAINPTNGLDSISYTADRPDGTAGHAFTGYTTELPRRSPTSAGSGQPNTAPTGSGAAGGSASARSGGLAGTGLSPLIALTGLGLLAAGLMVGRRSARRGFRPKPS